MADTRPNIKIPASTWVDLYAALNEQSGFPSVPVGTKLIVKLLSSETVMLTSQAEKPEDLKAYDLLVSHSVPVTNQSGDLGAWAYSISDSLINVRVV